MKRVILFIVTFSIVLYADLSLEQIRDMVSKIHEKRSGILLSTLETTKEPFVRLIEENNSTIFALPKKRKEIILTLHAILNNKAFINNKWIKTDESIAGYSLKYIGNNGVVLRNENNIKKLFLKDGKNTLIKISEKE